MMVIAFTGVKGAGKTTASNFLKEAIPELREVILADALKNASAMVFKIARNSFDDPKTKEKEFIMPIYLDERAVSSIFRCFNIEPNYDLHVRPHIGTVLHSPRRVAQYVGTEILRNYDSDIHCKTADLNIGSDGTFVITDMRFPSEYDYFHGKYGQNFYPYYINNFMAESYVDNHPSEKGVLEVAKHCLKIDNNGTLEDFRTKILKLSEDLMKNR
jgi:hypothetical protein